MLSRQLKPIVLILAILASCIAAQTPPPQNLTQGPVFRTGARDVVVDIVATDKDGHAVSGLHASDFAVFEDGKPQKIDFFEEHQSRALPPGSVAPLTPMPPGVYTNVPPAPESDAVNVLMLDMLNTPEQNFAYARNRVMQFLHNVTPGTRLAIVTLGDKLTFVTGFTTDASTLLAAIRDTRKGSQGQVSQSLTTRADQAEINSTLAMHGSSLELQSVGDVQSLAAAFTAMQRFDTANRIRMTLEALRDLARYLDKVPGRKNLIWFSSGFPVYIFPNSSESQADENMIVPLSEVRKTADALTAARVAVYPVTAEGMMNEQVMDADSPGIANTPSIGHLGFSSSGSPMTAYTADAAHRADTITEMNQLAADTGGKATYNTNDLGAGITRDIADGSQYYTLTYSPTDAKLDGKYRKIEIKVAEKKIKLSYRRGYNADQTGAPSPKQEQNPLHTLMFLGMPDSTEILYGIRAVPAAKQPAPAAPHAGANGKLADPVTRYSVDFLIRWTDLRLDPGPHNTHAGKIQVELLAYAPDGTALNWIGGTMNMNLKPGNFAVIQRSGVRAHLDIDVPQGKPFVLSTGVYDWLSGKAGTLQVALPPPANAQNAALPAAAPSR